ncbi:iron-dependent peroxidase [Paenibacillus sp. FSL R10-2782]|uniref:Iron-dependent peroxidase n=1 Tax=Paenibacillus terrae TaxID=159743 RepID=A0A4U2PNE7_9BACL|nr:iron-dependent peroxidase [Paenibacillus terrae]TKH40793.1 iron-dependent peroxidase [Paenibacillus terrae]
MNYVWDLLMRAREQELDVNSFRFVPAVSYSPYMELSLTELNTSELEQVVEINPYYRFYSIFRDLFPPDAEEYLELRESLFDIMMHFLAETDLYQGMNRREYHIQFVQRDIENGIFGPKVKESFAQLNREEQDAIAEGLLRLYETGEAVHLLKETMRRVFHRSIIYTNCEEKDELLIYIGQKETQLSRIKADLILDLFLPARFTIELYWTRHFGILEADPTMKIDAIALY